MIVGPALAQFCFLPFCILTWFSLYFIISLLRRTNLKPVWGKPTTRHPELLQPSTIVNVKHRHRRNVMSYRFKSLLIKKFLNYFHFFDYITQCILSAKFWCLTGCTNIAPRNFILSLRCIAFRICMACYRRNSTVSPGKFFLSKNNP